MKPKLLSTFLSSLIILPLALAPTRSYSQTNGNSSPPQELTPADDLELAEAEKLNQQIIELYNQGKYDTAIPLAQQALAIRKRILGEKHPHVATSLNNLALLYKNQGRYTEAEPLYRQALAMRQELLGQKHPDVASSLNNLALLYENQGRYTEAEPLYRQALAMLQELLGQKHPQVATSLNNLAALYHNQGRYTEAEPLYRQALAMRQELLGQKHPQVATSLNNLAFLYESQGRYTEAEPLYRQALAMRQELLGQKHPDVASSLNNLAFLYQNQGRYTEAEPLYRQALAMFQELLGQKHPQVATSLNNLALLYKNQGRYTEAEPLYRQALAMTQELLGQKNPQVATSLNNLAGLYQSQGRYTEAEPLYRQALAMYQELLGQKHPLVANSLNNLALLYQAKGDTTQAIKYLTQGADIQETNLDTNLTVGSERQKQEYMATISYTTDATISLHTQAAPDNKEAARLALTTILRRKGRILDAVTDNLKLIRQNLTPENQQLLDELAATRTQLAALIFNKPANLTTEEYQNQVANLKGKADRQEAELANRSTQFRVASQPVTIEAIQKLIPTDTALVEIIQYKPFNPKAKPEEKYGKPHYAAYILHPTGEPKWVDLGEAKPINQAVKEFRSSLQTEGLSIKKIARNLDEKVMKPIRPLLGNTKTILLSPDSQLNLIPFAALIDENNQYLVENYSINYLTTGRDLIRLQNQGESQDNPLLMADVDFNRAETSPPAPLLRGEGSKTPPFPRREGGLGGLGQNRRSSEIDELLFNPLPGTKAEADAIAPLLKNVTLLTGSQATENALKQIKSPPILHIATHGFFLRDLELVATANLNEGERLGVIPRPNNPNNAAPNSAENPLLRSGIVLAGSNKRQSGDEDGVLTALETTYLRLYGTKLVVLSACETGVGEAENGEGVYGLRRALVIAGAESQLMSLWRVSDEGTKDLMAKYYQRLLKNEGRSEALRQVQLEMLKDKGLQHPYFWSAFIPSGDWNPMED